MPMEESPEKFPKTLPDLFFHFLKPVRVGQKKNEFVGKWVFLPWDGTELDDGGYLCKVVAFRPSKKGLVPGTVFYDDQWMVRRAGTHSYDHVNEEIGEEAFQLSIRMYRKVIDGIDVGIRRRELLQELNTGTTDSNTVKIELAALGYNLFYSENSWYEHDEHGQHHLCLEYCPCGVGLPIYAGQKERLVHTHVEDIHKCVDSATSDCGAYELYIELCKDRGLPPLPFKLDPGSLWSPCGQYFLYALWP